ncbi:hypothetical protein GCM10010313_82110 [Streptomyces violarus]|nr:hypothetical protein GCM10010313_82110 [Streptomyces violarus]
MVRRTRAGGGAFGGTGMECRWCCPAAAQDAQMDGVPYSPVQIHQVRKRDAADRSFGDAAVFGSLRSGSPEGISHPWATWPW